MADSAGPVPGKFLLNPPSPTVLSAPADRFVAGLLCATVAIPCCLVFLGALIQSERLPLLLLVAFTGCLAFAGWAGAAIATEPYRRRATALGFCLVYFAPFLHWFLRKPSSYYFAGNVFLMLLCAGWWVVQFNENLARRAREAGDHAFRRAAMLSAWLCLVVFTILEIFVLGQVIWHQFEIGGGRFPHVMLPQWRNLFLLPFASTWITAVRAYARAGEWGEPFETDLTDHPESESSPPADR